MAGIILKNNVSKFYHDFPVDVATFIKAEALRCLGDPAPLIRATLGILITTIAFRGKIGSWPELLPTLMHYIGTDLQTPDLPLCEVCVLTFITSKSFLLLLFVGVFFVGDVSGEFSSDFLA
jgi:hypothetical protein